MSAAPKFHHIAIQTCDLPNSVGWYEAFLDCRPAWSLTTFSDLTRSRLPGIRSLTELVVGDARLHLFERDGRPAPTPGDSVVQYQHFCLSVDAADDLANLRRRWVDLYDSRRYTFAVAEPPTEIVTDDDGIQSFYAFDPNGLELEFTYVPNGGS